MRNVVPVQTPSLFTPTDSLLSEPLPPVETVEQSGPQPQKIAREFIAWCCSFEGFRNSPDVGNFRFWLQKIRAPIPDLDESAVLLEARRLLLKRIQQSISSSVGGSEAH